MPSLLRTVNLSSQGITPPYFFITPSRSHTHNPTPFQPLRQSSKPRAWVEFPMFINQGSTHGCPRYFHYEGVILRVELNFNVPSQSTIDSRIVQGHLPAFFPESLGNLTRSGYISSRLENCLVNAIAKLTGKRVIEHAFALIISRL